MRAHLSNECPWCKECFYDVNGLPDKAARDEHCEDNACGLIPRRELQMVRLIRRSVN
jgi:hypothetical protein